MSENELGCRRFRIQFRRINRRNGQIGLSGIIGSTTCNSSERIRLSSSYLTTRVGIYNVARGVDDPLLV